MRYTIYLNNIIVGYKIKFINANIITMIGEEKQAWKFWGDQPVAQSRKQLLSCDEEKPIDILKTLDDIDQIPLTLPDTFFWHDVNIDDPVELNCIYCLLRDHYVEATNMFRFDYSKEFLKWALKSPGWKRSWHLSIRSNNGNKPFVGFITAIPVNVIVQSQTHKMVEINFLCVHRKLRHHRMAPVGEKREPRFSNRLEKSAFRAFFLTGSHQRNHQKS